MALSTEQRKTHARLVCIREFGFDPKGVGVGVGSYDEWYEKVGASLWRDAEISTADIMRAAWEAATKAALRRTAIDVEETDDSSSGVSAVQGARQG